MVICMRDYCQCLCDRVRAGCSRPCKALLEDHRLECGGACACAGTLTRNEMEFFKCSIAGVSYGTGVTEIERAAARRNGLAVLTFDPPVFLFLIRPSSAAPSSPDPFPVLSPD